MKLKAREREIIEAARREAAELAAAEACATEVAGSASEGAHAPEKLEGYEIRGVISRGGQGLVYRARQRSTGRDVAVKVMREGPFAGPLELARFQREIRILGQLRHPNIVCIHDSGEAAGHFYYVMDYIPGQTLDVFLANHPLCTREIVQLFLKVCCAAAAAHARGIIHRDLKPQNIRVGEDREPQVLDFGLAKLCDAEQAAEVTMTGSFLGSLPWASPEQTEGRPDQIGLYTDVYALGVLLYHMISGAFPYEVSGSLMDVMTRIKSHPPRPLRRVSPERVDRDVETIVGKALEKEPERRYQSAGEMARDVEHWLAGDPISARTSTAYILRKQLVRHRILASFVGLLLLFATTAGVLLIRHFVQLANRDRLTVAVVVTGFSDFEDPFRAPTPAASTLDVIALALDDGAVPHSRTEVRLRELLSIGYLQLERISEALEQANIAYTMCRQALPPSDREHADTAQILGRALFHDGRLHRSEHFYREASRLHEQQRGRDSASFAANLDELGGCVRKLGRFAEAENLRREALAIRRAVLPPNDPYIDASLHNLAICLIDRGEFEEAELLLLEVWESVHEIPKFNPAYLIRTQRWLAVCRLRSGDVAAARRRLEGALAIEGGGTLERALLTFELGRCAQAEGSLAAAEAHLRESVEMHRSLSNSFERLEAIEAQAHLAMVLIDLARIDEAERLLAEAAHSYRQQLDPSHPALAWVRAQQARALLERGRREEAKDLLTSSLDVQRANLRPDHPDLRLTERLFAGLQ